MAKKTSAPEQGHAYLRFPLMDRIQHVVMLLSFTTLGITGLVQKYPLNSVPLFIIRLWGGVENIRATHHVAATMLMLVAIYHLVGMGYKIFVLRHRMTMLPSLQDIKDAWMAFTYNIGFGKSRPQMGRYTFEEKAEYWALIWGTAVMGITGYMMWNPLATVKFVPGDFIPAAKAAHGAEAVLAVLAIIVWHMYGVHLKRFNKAMWTGQLTEEEMLHEHPLELADIKAGMAVHPVDATTLRKRQTIYYPIATVLSIAMLFAIYGFVNGEQTAITTVPARIATIPVYVPETPTALPPTPTPLPSPTPAPTVEASTGTSAAPALTWAKVGSIFASKCLACHGPAASGGLILSSYADAMKGGKDGPVIVPNDAANSKLFIIQSAGGHLGQLSADELAVVKQWINSGALEK